MANMHIKRGSTALIIRAMKIKTTVRCHPISIKMATNKTKQKITSTGKAVEKLEPWCNWWDCKMIPTTLEVGVAVLQKANDRTMIGSSDLPLGIHPKELKAGSQRHLHTHVHSSIILTTAKR